MNIQLKTVFGDLILEGDFSSVADAVKAALAAKKSLRYANLRYADLRYADLSYADLSYADLRYADLSYADLSYADLRSANLSSANLSSIKNDFWAVLTCAASEVPFLRRSLVGGLVNGTSYTGECACLVGTLAKSKGCAYTGLEFVKPDQNRPSERFFLGIKTGDTPETNPVSELAVEWLDEWARMLGRDVTESAPSPAK